MFPPYSFAARPVPLFSRGALICVLASSVAVSCGDDPAPAANRAPGSAPQESPASATPNQVLAPPPSPSPPPQSPSPSLAPRTAFARAAQPSPEWDVENRARLDPGTDGWPTEAFHDRAKPLLDALLACALGAAPAEQLASVLDASFEGSSELRPALTNVRSAASLRVDRASAFDSALRPASEFAALCDALRAPFSGAAPRLECRVEAVEPVEGGYRMLASWSACAQAAGRVVELRARWWVRWLDRGPQAPPTVRAIELVEHTEASAPRPLFADHTGRWLLTATGVAEELRAGLSERHFRNDQLTANALLGGQGLAVGDVNGDGLDDVYVPMQGGLPNRLLLARPDGTVMDVSTQARVALLDNTRGALIVDMDGDGARDLVLAVGSNVLIAYNDGEGVFKEQLVLRAGGSEDIFSLAAADPDRDGDLDLYACRYVQGGMIAGVPTPYHDARNGARNVYWRNDGRGKLVDATDEVGLAHNNSRYSLAALWEDLDDDGDLDLYVANDFGRNNLYRNDDGRFVDVAEQAGVEDPAAGMGISVADFDLDGRLDLYVSNMYSAAGLRSASRPERFLDGRFLENHAHYVRHARGNTLLRGLGEGRFEDVTERFHVGPAGWAWGALFADFDADGYEDLFSPNGFISGAGEFDVESFFWRRVISQSPQDAVTTESYRNAWGSMQKMVMEEEASYNGRERDTAFVNLGGADFADVSFVTGLDALSDSRAIARVDWDEDGRLDLLVKSRSGPRLRFLRNQCEAPGHFLSLELRGANGNVDAIGARVVVELEGRSLTKSIYAGEGYLAQSSRRLHFGLGDQTEAKQITVRWPSGAVSRYEKLAADARYALVEGQPQATRVELRKLDLYERNAPSPLAPLRDPVVRVPLAERMPMAEYAFAMLDGSVRKVREFAGAPLFITLWSSKAAGCVEQIAALDRCVRSSTLGARWIAATLDQGPDLLEARRVAASLGIADRTALLDPHAAKLVELQFLLVLGRAHHAPLPSTLLLDASGQLSVIYLGGASERELAEDLKLVAELDPNSRGTNKLTGGRWLARASRDYAFLASVCRDLGANELAQFYAEIAAGESK